MVWRSSVTKAHSQSKTLRTTIPEEVCAECGIYAGDLLAWSVIRKNGKRNMLVRKIDMS